MNDEDCVDLLQWALPRLDMRWEGFRKVRDQVCKRVDRRIEELGLSDVDAYRDRLEVDADEWEVLDGFCRITIFRFHRDREVWRYLRQEVIPDLLRRLVSDPEPSEDQRRSPPNPPEPSRSPSPSSTASPALRVWSAGCGAGEEPYTLSIIWELELGDRFPGVDLRVVATDAEPAVLERARRARYQPATLKELPNAWIDSAFEERSEEAPGVDGDSEREAPGTADHPEDTMQLKSRFREPVELREQDIRTEMPA
ncbi:MAG: CheR family methyltransferase, partial [Longimicrobiales bacterium]|nr:CheR family methyltransferase [Longimicrobiales bacterium]